jgi:hypothetical protein
VLRVPGEYPTINAGLSASVSGDTVLVAPGVYSDFEVRLFSSGEIASCAFLVGGVLLLSEGGPEVTTIDMHDVGTPWKHVVVLYQEAETAEIEGFTITESVPGEGSVYVGHAPTLVIRECVFLDMEEAPDGNGGAVSAVSADLEIVGCRFVNCHAARGGAIWQFDGRIVVEDSDFAGCSNGAIGLMGEQGINPEAADIRGCRFTGNYTEGGGGGIEAGIYGELVVSGCVFQDNIAYGGGGAANLAGISNRVEGCVFVRNRTLSPLTRGGALSVYSGTMVENCTFFENEQAYVGTGGSAITYAGGASVLSNNIVAASVGGAAIYVRSGHASVTSSCNVFWENEGGIGDGYTPGPTDQEVNPLFCDPGNEDLSLAENSPCLPPQSGACGLIGALGEGCGAISVESRSWGRIKDLYR